jgi:hypothetical protein
MATRVCVPLTDIDAEEGFTVTELRMGTAVAEIEMDALACLFTPLRLALTVIVTEPASDPAMKMV